MKRQIIVKNSGFVQYISTPLVADDVQAYEIILNAGQDITGCSFTVTATRADGVKVSGAGTVSGNTAKYTLENNMHSVPGVMTARLTLIDQLGSVLTDHELHFDVVDGNGDPDLSGDDRVPALNQIIINATAAANSANNAANFAQEKGAYAEKQGDYAKSRADDFPIPDITNDGDVLTVGQRQEGEDPHSVSFVAIGGTNSTYRFVCNYANSGLNVTENSLVGLRFTADITLAAGGGFSVDGPIIANEMRSGNQTVVVLSKSVTDPNTTTGDRFDNAFVYTPKYVPAPEWKEINLDEKLAGKADKQNSFGGFQAGDGAYATSGVAIGINANATDGGAAIGANAKSTLGGGAIGVDAKTEIGGAVGHNAYSKKGCAVGYGARAGDGAAIGYHAITETNIDAVQLGTGTNTTAQTLQVYDYQLMDASGKIPVDRLPGNFSAVYDIVIDSQSKWDTMVASATWNGVKSVALACDITESKTIDVPENVKLLCGYGHTINTDGNNFRLDCRNNCALDNLNIAGSTMEMGLIYNCPQCSCVVVYWSAPKRATGTSIFIQCKSMVGCYVVDNSNETNAIYPVYFFYNCKNIINCGAIWGNTDGNAPKIGLYECDCIANFDAVCNITNADVATLFFSCSHISNISISNFSGIKYGGAITKRDDDSCDLE